jgi:hypothetical protein
MCIMYSAVGIIIIPEIKYELYALYLISNCLVNKSFLKYKLKLTFYFMIFFKKNKRKLMWTKKEPLNT